MLSLLFKKSVHINKYIVFVALTLFIMLFLYIIWLYIENNSLLLQMVLKYQTLSEVFSEALSSYQSITIIYDSNVSNSSILGGFTGLTEEFKKFLSTLSSEELACLFNSFGFLMIFFSFTNIVTVLFGDFIINKLQLENIFPRLAKYLKLRQTINKYFLTFNILLVYLIILIFIYVNINRILS